MLRCQSDLFQNGLDLGISLCQRGIIVMNIQSLSDDVLHLLARIQRRHRILENHLHLCAQHGRGLSIELAADVRAVKDNFPGCRIIQTDDGAANG